MTFHSFHTLQGCWDSRSGPSAYVSTGDGREEFISFKPDRVSENDEIPNESTPFAASREAKIH
jgi:hypothetical protein